jgi:hypothetical protein
MVLRHTPALIVEKAQFKPRSGVALRGRQPEQARSLGVILRHEVEVVAPLGAALRGNVALRCRPPVQPRGPGGVFRDAVAVLITPVELELRVGDTFVRSPANAHICSGVIERVRPFSSKLEAGAVNVGTDRK